jgi:phosphoribosylglycinamide formyltransferase 2
MFQFSSPYKSHSKRLLLLGSGELGKELLIEAHKWGIETHAVARYKNAPASQVAHFSYQINMLDKYELKLLVRQVRPDFIVPEIESINIEALLDLEKEGYNIVPSAKAVYYTMDRERIRKLAAEDFGFLTSKYRFAETFEEFTEAVTEIGFPCVVKPTMSSSGYGQSKLMNAQDIETAWTIAHNECRGECRKVIVEEYINFDHEVTLITVKHLDSQGTSTVSFCPPIGHEQKNGDFAKSWQNPELLWKNSLEKCQNLSSYMVNELSGKNGFGVFGVEFFLKGSTVYFNEIAPRPHDTAFLTLKTQNMSQFELHIRAILKLPIPKIKLLMSGASVPLVVKEEGTLIERAALDTLNIPKHILELEDTSLYVFGKPYVKKKRRMGIIVTTAPTLGMALQKVNDIHIYKN